MQNNHKGVTRQTLYEDSLFRDAVKETARIEGENLLKENKQLSTDDIGVSSEKQIEFRRRLEKALQDKKNKERRISHIKTLQRVAVITLVFSAALAISLLSVDAFRVNFLNFFMEIKSEYTEFRLEDENKNSDGVRLMNWSNAYVPTYVPEGYQVESSENGDTLKLITFQNSDGQMINYAQYTENVAFNYDTEGAELRDIVVNGDAGTLIVKESHYSIVWKYENSIFVVMTQINEQETLKIAESLEFIK